MRIIKYMEVGTDELAVEIEYDGKTYSGTITEDSDED